VSNRRRVLAVLAGFAIIASSCGGGDSISRIDAITALQTTGISAAEATCVADSLVALGELDAADPREVRGTKQRDALVASTARCVGNDVETEVAGVQTEPDLAPSLATTSRRPADSPDLGSRETTERTRDEAEVRRAAIETLERLGRKNPDASCVVDHILTAGAIFVLVEPNFGLGLSPVEADAFAACANLG